MSRPNLAIVQQREIDPEQAVTNNLPLQPTPIVGRESEIEAISRRLLQPDLRLLTLVGPGGVGKTRLAIQVAQALAPSFVDGVWFVGLAPISDPSLVIPTVAQALNLHALPGQPILAVLKGHLRDKNLLLLLDNFEQVMPAGAALAELLAGCSRLKIMVTSRSALHLRGEHEFPVPPLSLPGVEKKRPNDVEALQQYSAVALFGQRAASVRPDFTINNANAAAVVEICTRLDGLPLAIELVAARVKLLQPQAIQQRLQNRLHLLTGGAQDLPARQQTLRNAIEWSYDLLAEEEQALFRRLAVFVGGCTLEAAESVCDFGFRVLDFGLEKDKSKHLRAGTGNPNSGEPASSIQNPKPKIQNILDGIGSLIDKSLLRQVEADGEGEPHYSMLETIREYALEQLEASGEGDEVRDRHALYFMKKAEETEPLLTGAAQKECFDRLEREHDNFRAALKWCQARTLQMREAELGMRNMSQGDSLRVSNSQASTRNIPHSEFIIPNSAEVGLRMAGALGRFWSGHDHLAEGREWLQAALARTEADAPTEYRTKALNAVARIADNQGDYEAVRKYCRECLDLKHQMHDTANIASGYILLAKAESNEGNYSEARRLLQEGLEVARSVDDQQGFVHCLNGLGELERLQNDYNAARERYEECLQLFRQMGNTNGIGFSLHNLAYVYIHEKSYDRATSTLDEALALYKGLGNKLGIAMCVAALSGLALHAGAPQRAARLLGAAQALLDSIGALLDPADLKEYKENEGVAREKLGEAAFLAAWAEGHAMTPEQVVAIGDTQEITNYELSEQWAAGSGQKLSSGTPPNERVIRNSGAAESRPARDSLSVREIDVLRLVARGLSDAQVAAQLYLSPHTVRAHIRSIYSKIGVTSRSAATRYAAENNLT